MVQATMAQATLVQGKPGPAHESLHIWEQPLPQEPVMEGYPNTGTYQNQSSMGTMPCRGTMTGPPKAPIEVGGNDDQSQSGSWKGTQRYYDKEQGWVLVAAPQQN